jgi:hypothetical protein
MNSYEQWNVYDEKELIKYYEKNYTLSDIGFMLKRTKNSIRSKLVRLGKLNTNQTFTKKTIKTWSNDEIIQLLNLYNNKTFTIKQMAIICNKSVQSIKYKLFQLNLQMPKKFIEPRSYNLWTINEIDKLIILRYKYKCSIDYIAKLLKRTKNAIIMKIKKIN